MLQDAVKVVFFPSIFLALQLANIDQTELVAWGTAIATVVGTIAATLEVGGRRLIRMWVEEHGKLTGTERGQYQALQSRFDELVEAGKGGAAERAQLRELLFEKLSALEEMGGDLADQLARNLALSQQVLDLTARIDTLVAENTRFRCRHPLGDGARCSVAAPPPEHIERTDAAYAKSIAPPPPAE